MKKFNKLSIILSVLLILLVLISSILGYLYFKAKSDYNKLQDRIASLEAENESLKNEKQSLESQIAALTAELDTCKSDKEAVKKYNDFLTYLTNVVDTYGGVPPSSEYQKLRDMAQATGDDELVTALDQAWANINVFSVTNVVKVASEGIGQYCD